MLEADLQRSAEGFQWGHQLPLGRLAIHLHGADVQMAGIENDFPGFGIGDGLELVDHIAGQLLLIKVNIEIGGDMSGAPIVVIA